MTLALHFEFHLIKGRGIDPAAAKSGNFRTPSQQGVLEDV